MSKYPPTFVILLILYIAIQPVHAQVDKSLVL